jgi:septin family protein
VHGEKWTYYRYRIRKFDLTEKDGLLAIHNAVRNVLKSHLPEHVQRLRDALAALPDPCDQPGSTGLSFVASEISLNADNSQQDRDADGFVVPLRPDSSQNSGAKKKGQESRLAEQIERLRQEHKEELERQRKEREEEREENRKREERQRQEHKEEMERQRKESEEKMEKLLQRLLAKPAD